MPVTDDQGLAGRRRADRRGERRTAPRPRAVQARVTVVVTALVALALGAASVGLVLSLQAGAVGRARRVAEGQVRTVVAALRDGQAPETLALEQDLALLPPTFVQVLDDDGTILTQLPPPEFGGIAVFIPISQPREPAGDEFVVHAQSDLVVVHTTVETPRRALTVVAVSPLTESAHSVDTLTQGLVVGAPLLTTLVAILTWVGVGRAARPAVQLRREVDGASATARRVETASARERRLLTDAVRELRRPIAALRSEVESAMGEPHRADWDAIAATVLREAGGVEDLVDDLSVLVRLDDGAPPQATEVALHRLVDDEVARVAGIEVDAARLARVRIRGDRALLSRAVRELLDNAVRHARSHVAVELQRLGATAVLSVEDDGPGITRAEREIVFEPFARLVDGVRDRGPGLGLAVTRAIVHHHGGRISAVDGTLGGARFEVELPALDDPGARPLLSDSEG